MNSKSAPAIPVDRLTHIDDEATTYAEALARERANIHGEGTGAPGQAVEAIKEFPTVESQQYIMCTARGDCRRVAKIAVAEERAVRVHSGRRRDRRECAATSQ